MDLVYILGTGSTWNDNEIRYSLRSVQKNVLDLGNVFIVGEYPPFIQNAIHIPCHDNFKTKWLAGYTKFVSACNDPRVSSDFLMMNDDFFFLRPVRACTYPYYYSGTIPVVVSKSKNHGLTSPYLTARCFIGRKKYIRNYAVHRPMIFNKEKFLAMPPPNPDLLGFSFRSFYANYYKCSGIYCKDLNLSPLDRLSQYDRISRDRSDISIFSATARSPIFRCWIHSKFPDPSRFERSFLDV